MKIDPQINAERQAARKKRQQEQRYPLLHHAGILEQIEQILAVIAQPTNT